MSPKYLTLSGAAVALSLVSGPAHAQPAGTEPEGEAGAGASGEASGEVKISPELRKPFSGDASGEAGGGADTTAEPAEAEEPRTKPRLSKRLDRKWIKRWAPENNTGELGVFFGLLFPSDKTELFEPDRALPRQGQKAFGSVAPDIGLRLGYYPIRFIGLEAEAAVMPTSVDGGGRGTLWSVRGHAVAQLGLWSITPFVVVGGGALAVNSARSAVGNDVDQALYFGGGLKAYLSRYVALRLDVRDILTPRVGLSSGPTNNVEVLLGLSVTLGRKKDHDTAPEPTPEPHPAAAPGDRDGDGFLDPDDRCPDDPGVAPDGCPIGDRDGDGFVDDVDACPDEAGVEPDGCPIGDRDEDGFLDDVDKCVDEPEVVNGFEDDDGCPDDVPDEIRKFEGTLEGIYFDVNKSAVKSQSRTVLDGAAETLKKFPNIRVEISGHTDSTGSRDHNMELSAARAGAVRDYLVSKGVDASRIETRGAGPDEPIDSNSTKDGRSKNRRIEFRILR